uniref:RING-type domain-containing protein n=1 Tax=Ciona savignyi TaxID=51511 RepID=H2YCF1_CIOSA
MDSLENELTCPICLDLFHEPILLPCAHNLCSGCVDQFVASHCASGDQSGFLPTFKCPTCREVITLDSKGNTGLRRNLTLQNIVDGYPAAAILGRNNPTRCSILSQIFEILVLSVPAIFITAFNAYASNLSMQSDGSLGPSRGRRRSRQETDGKDYVQLTTPMREVRESTDQVSCQFCELKPPRQAVKTCLTCKAYYCDRCLRVTHPRKKPFINHKLVPASPGNAGTLSAKSKQLNAVHCFHHVQESADLYCPVCDMALCKSCSLKTDHAHGIECVTEWAFEVQKTTKKRYLKSPRRNYGEANCSTKNSLPVFIFSASTKRVFMFQRHAFDNSTVVTTTFEDNIVAIVEDLEMHVTRLSNQKAEIQRNVTKLVEACQQIEVTAESQESKLHSEVESLIRVIREREAAIVSRIKDTKTTRLRKLTQEVTSSRQCLESLHSSVMYTGADQLAHRNARATYFRSGEPITQTNSLAQKITTPDCDIECPGFYLDFSQERAMLERMNIMEAPSPPKICEELCTQSHDKVTIQWRSPDHRHVAAYELQYAV